MGKAQTALRKSAVSFTGEGGNPYARPSSEMFRPRGWNHLINFVMPGWYGDAMGPHHHHAQDTVGFA